MTFSVDPIEISNDVRRAWPRSVNPVSMWLKTCLYGIAKALAIFNCQSSQAIDSKQVDAVLKLFPTLRKQSKFRASNDNY